MTKLFKNIPSLLIILTILATLVSCKSEHPRPENLDPIYKDLVSDYNSLHLQIKTTSERVKKLQSDYDNSEVRSLDKRIAEKDLRAAKEQLKDLRQMEKYLKIRVERRRIEGRRAYRLAFQKGETWPDPKEFEAYRANKKLREAPRQWGARVPKLFEDNPNFKGPPKN